MHQLTVQEVIDRLMKVKDKSRPCSIWINSKTPEPVYSGGSRVPIVHVDDTQELSSVDFCCEELHQISVSYNSGV